MVGAIVSCIADCVKRSNKKRPWRRDSWLAGGVHPPFSRMCGKQGTLSPMILDVWQGKELQVNFSDVWQMEEIEEKTCEENNGRGVHPRCDGKSPEAIKTKGVAGVHSEKVSPRSRKQKG